MHRIDTTHKSVDLFGSGKHGYTNGTPGSVGATETDAAHFNAIQEELCGIVESMGGTLVKGTNTQVLTGLKTLGLLASTRGWWAVRTEGSAKYLNCIAYSSALNIWVAAGENIATPTPYIVSSVGGQTWTPRTEATNVTVNAICWDPVGAAFVLVGNATGGKPYILGSTTGTSFTKYAASVPALNFAAYGVAQNNNGLIVLVGQSTGAVDGPLILSASTVSGTWTQRKMAVPADQPLYAVEHNKLTGASGLWVAVGGNVGSGLILTSATGAANDWTVRVSGVANVNFRGVAYGNGRWVVVGTNSGAGGAYNVRVSTDGTSWTSVNISTAQILRAVSFTNGVFVAVGENDGESPELWSSVDGATWTKSYQGANLSLLGVHGANGKFIAVGVSTGASPYILESAGSVF